MKKIGIIFIIISSLCWTAQGQDYSSKNKKAVKLFEAALQAMDNGKREVAKDKLEQSLKEDPDFMEAHLVMADWLQEAMEYDSKQSGETDFPSAPTYRKEIRKHLLAVVNQRRDFFVPAWLQLGKTDLADGQYDEAIRSYETFLELEKRDAKSRKEAQNGLEASRFRKEALAHPVPFEPKNLGATVNSQYDEYLPSLTVDNKTLVFTRRFPRTANTTANTKEEEDLYMCTWNNGNWGKAVRMPDPVNSTDNEGAQCISQDGRIMFYTACNRPDGGGRCDLYMCVNKGGNWSKPRNLGPDVNSGAWESNPTFSIDGKTLYFVSNRKGGQGGMDIWKTVFENGRWSEPVNLGPEVNSEWDEMSPFIHFDDRTLYFASNRPAGMGGLDLFKATRQDDGSWSQPVNLGYPINTEGDESGLIVSAEARTAIYSSNRQRGIGRQDLYSFDLPVAVRPTVTICFQGTVTNAKTGQPVGADIRMTDIRNGVTVANTTSDGKSGTYTVSLPADGKYAFHVSAEGYLMHSQNEVWNREEQQNSSWEPLTVDIALHPIASGERIALNNVFFETGKWEILSESAYELGKVVELLNQNPKLRVELGGHTDNVGKPEANQRLSEQRAKAVYEYLISKGIAAERLSYKGYGETQPVADNGTEEGRAKNRRTEMKVM